MHQGLPSKCRPRPDAGVQCLRGSALEAPLPPAQYASYLKCFPPSTCISYRSGSACV